MLSLICIVPTNILSWRYRSYALAYFSSALIAKVCNLDQVVLYRDFRGPS